MPNLGEGRTVAQRSCLPRDLSRRGSDLDRLITIAGDAAAEGTFGAANTVAVTRSMIRRLCPDYRPSKACRIDVLCGSGEDNGQPIRTGVRHLSGWPVHRLRESSSAMSFHSRRS